MLVSQILKSKGSEGVVTVQPGLTVAQAAEVLSQKKIGALVISKDGKTLAGIVSERDIVREVGRRGPSCLNDSVDSIMTAKVVTCVRADQTDAVLQKMTDGRFRHIPVIEGGQLVGLISIGDVVKAKLSELSMEKDALEGMIKGF
ncbi:CBS domain-containing protein [Tabrizicola oligotrophica]|uniref:CBS domain-containing protein n=1 Tax=Tabrizicola oligotrophica TaxID=2710650 RepID=A0A6M0QRA4_9RHOB|nr:CBS domain-containing protein [Tabrizicola oligotrophica]NEY88952.1 CBS domain-containing protein [Tabrizicola oligotrophica]